jgi:hypothetical protein
MYFILLEQWKASRGINWRVLPSHEQHFYYKWYVTLSIIGNLSRQLRLRNSGMMDNLSTIHNFRNHGCMILNLGTTHKFTHKYIRMIFNFTHHTKAVQEVLGVLKQLPFNVSWRPRNYVRGLKDSLDSVYILGAFAKLRKATISFVMSVRSSVYLSARNNRWLPLDGFSLNLIFYYFAKVCRKSYSFIKNRTRVTGTLHEHQHTFVIVSRSFLLRIKNV